MTTAAFAHLGAGIMLAFVVLAIIARQIYCGPALREDEEIPR